MKDLNGFSESFIAQTAKDYDMSIAEVSRIAKFHSDKFYEELEVFIADRAKQSNTSQSKSKHKDPTGGHGGC